MELKPREYLFQFSRGWVDGATHAVAYLAQNGFIGAGPLMLAQAQAGQGLRQELLGMGLTEDEIVSISREIEFLDSIEGEL